MKISLNNTTKTYSNSVNNSKRDSGVSSPQVNTRNFDAVTIQSDPVQIAEKKFLSSVTSALSAEVRQPTSSEKIENLKDQVTNDTYQIDTEEIASSILLSGKENSHA